ncbi:glutamate--tRNA ligase, partial [Campylobacter jejuni]|nr:glutamate--tRNA ligase [Campylobacter jejuni]
SNLKGKKFFMPLRIILTGNIHGPELSDLYPYIKNFIHELARI